MQINHKKYFLCFFESILRGLEHGRLARQHGRETHNTRTSASGVMVMWGRFRVNIALIGLDQETKCQVSGKHKHRGNDHSQCQAVNSNKQVMNIAIFLSAASTGKPGGSLGLLHDRNPRSWHRSAVGGISTPADWGAESSDSDDEMRCGRNDARKRYTAGTLLCKYTTC